MPFLTVGLENLKLLCQGETKTILLLNIYFSLLRSNLLFVDNLAVFARKKDFLALSVNKYDIDLAPLKKISVIFRLNFCLCVTTFVFQIILRLSPPDMKTCFEWVTDIKFSSLQL